ncbi:hypothetical protein R3P38DRAFT_2773683 [Favolaschia claudopus]|uniref:Uncharacterized protein n=1 Tax=Favolaschia claudopus TaxID=2862362 RepID=A0AAW0C2T1_9AGAR
MVWCGNSHSITTLYPVEPSTSRMQVNTYWYGCGFGDASEIMRGSCAEETACFEDKYLISSTVGPAADLGCGLLRVYNYPEAGKPVEYPCVHTQLLPAAAEADTGHLLTFYQWFPNPCMRTVTFSKLIIVENDRSNDAQDIKPATAIKFLYGQISERQRIKKQGLEWSYDPQEGSQLVYKLFESIQVVLTCLGPPWKDLKL